MEDIDKKIVDVLTELQKEGTYDVAKYEMYQDLGMLYKGKGDYNTALEYYNRAFGLLLAEKVGIICVYPLYRKIGEVHQLKGNLDKALGFYEKAFDNLLTIEHADATFGISDDARLIYNKLKEVHEAKDSNSTALEYYDKVLEYHSKGELYPLEKVD